MIVVIPGKLPTLNEIINASKGNKYAYVAMKDKAINTVGWTFRQAMPGQEAPQKADYVFTWYCKDKRTDKDNIMAGQKFVFDALQQIGFIKNDGWKQIGNVSHRFEIDKANPRIEIEIIEIKEDIGA